MRDFAHPFCLSYFLFLFLVLPIAYSQDARTDFNVKYAERRGPAQGCAFRVNRETIFKTLVPFYTKNRQFLGRFSAENRLMIKLSQTNDG